MTARLFQAPAAGRRAGLTLLEVIVSLAVIAVLVSIAVPALSSARAAAHRAGCLANLRTLGVAVQMYRDDHDGALPYAERLMHVAAGWTKPLDALTPYLDSAPPRVDDTGRTVTGPPWRCPADPDFADRTGVSYGYAPIIVMPSLAANPLLDEAAARLATLTHYDREPYTGLVFRDMGDWHPRVAGDDDSQRNVLRFDGSVGPASEDDTI